MSIIASMRANQVFEYFKPCNVVEQMIEAFKSAMQAAHTCKCSEQNMEVWMFINHLALMFSY